MRSLESSRRPCAIASSRQDRSLSRRKASHLARRCVGLCIIKSGCSESRERVDRWRVRRLVGLFGGCRVRMLVVIAKTALVVVSRARLVLSQEASSRLAAHRRLRRLLEVLLEGSLVGSRSSSRLLTGRLHNIVSGLSPRSTASRHIVRSLARRRIARLSSRRSRVVSLRRLVGASGCSSLHQKARRRRRARRRSRELSPLQRRRDIRLLAARSRGFVAVAEAESFSAQPPYQGGRRHSRWLFAGSKGSSLHQTARRARRC